MDFKKYTANLGANLNSWVNYPISHNFLLLIMIYQSMIYLWQKWASLAYFLLYRLGINTFLVRGKKVTWFKTDTWVSKYTYIFIRFKKIIITRYNDLK